MSSVEYKIFKLLSLFFGERGLCFKIYIRGGNDRNIFVGGGAITRFYVWGNMIARFLIGGRGFDRKVCIGGYFD